MELLWVWVLKNKTISKNQHTTKKIIQREMADSWKGKNLAFFDVLSLVVSLVVFKKYGL